MSKLTYYFQHKQSAFEALDRYKQFALEREWYIGGDNGKLRLYSLAECAFNPNTPRFAALKAFGEAYNSVRRWPGVQRGGSLAPSEQVFDTILAKGLSFVDDTNIDLTNLVLPSCEVNNLVPFLRGLHFIKPNQDYPWMPVSKVLHFANPKLFPIWDWDVLWYKVMWKENGRAGRRGAFSQEYRAFCGAHGFKQTENDAVFLSNYMLWAASYIQGADTGFMQWFSEWLMQSFGDDVKKYGMKERVHTLYATAFEFVAIGAAYLEMAAP